MIIILVSGKRGAGKSTIAKALVDIEGFQHIELSSIGKLIRNSVGFKGKLRNFVTIKHKEAGRDFLVQYIYHNKLIVSRNIVISGIRNSDEVDFIKLHYKDYRVLLTYIDTPFLVRMYRVVFRKQKNSIKDFFLDEYFSIKWGSNKIRTQAKVISNKEELNATLQTIKNLLWTTK